MAKKPKPAAAPKKGISRAAIDAAPRRATQTAEQIFTIAEPPPGVVPAGEPRLAMDDQLTGLYTYGAGQCGAGFGGYGGFYAFPGYPYLAALAQQSEYRQGFETLAREMTRKWVRIKGGKRNSGKVKKLEDALKRFKVQDKFRRWLELDGNFGRAHLFIDVKDVGDDTLALPMLYDPRFIKKDSLRDITVVDPTWCYPAVYNASEPLKPDFYKPQTWYVMQRRVHATRLLTLITRPVPDLLKPAYSFGGVSLVQLMQQAVNKFLKERGAVSELVTSFSTMVLHTDMSSVLNGGQGLDVANRVALYNNYRDNSGCFLVNAENGNGTAEDLTNVAVPLGTLDKLQAQAQEQQAAPIGCPLVVLLGYTPTGLNTTPEGEIRVWYDRTHANQEASVGDHFNTIFNILQLNEFGAIDPSITWEFEPLWQLDDVQKAAQQKTTADTHAVYLQEGVVGPEDVQAVLKSDEDSLYRGVTLGPPPGPPEMDEEEPGSGGEKDPSKDPDAEA